MALARCSGQPGEVGGGGLDLGRDLVPARAPGFAVDPVQRHVRVGAAVPPDPIELVAADQQATVGGKAQGHVLDGHSVGLDRFQAQQLGNAPLGVDDAIARPQHVVHRQLARGRLGAACASRFRQSRGDQDDLIAVAKTAGQGCTQQAHRAGRLPRQVAPGWKQRGLHGQPGGDKLSPSLGLGCGHHDAVAPSQLPARQRQEITSRAGFRRGLLGRRRVELQDIT